MSLRPNARTEVRRNRYKVAVDAEEGRRRREDNMVEIRKNKREENLQKKRREGLQANQQFSVPVQATVEKKLENLPAMVAGVWTEDGNLQLEATTQFRKLLSIERSPPIEEVIQAGVVPRFVQFLIRDDFPQLQVFMPCFHNLEVPYGVEVEKQSLIVLDLFTSMQRRRKTPTSSSNGDSSTNN